MIRRARVSVNDADGQKITLAELAGADFFGEMALLDGEPRSADVTVIGDARFAVLSRQTFLIFTRSHPNVAINMLSAQTRMLGRTDELFRQRVSRNVNEEQEARITLGDRVADRIASFGGSWKFIIAALFFLALWVIANAWFLRNGSFDPFPFILLNLVLGIVAGMQGPIIMMAQNRQTEKDRLRSDMD